MKVVNESVPLLRCPIDIPQDDILTVVLEAGFDMDDDLSACGYNKNELAADLIAVFSQPPSPRSDLHDVVRCWQHRIQTVRNADQSVAMRAPGWATRFARFYTRLGRSRLRQALLDECGGDAVQAAATFLRIVSSIELTSRQCQTDRVLSRMSLALGDGTGGIDIPFGPPRSGGREAGHDHRTLVARRWRISEVLKRIQIRYEPYAIRHHRTREIHEPDDVDVVPLRSYSTTDLSRILMCDLAVPDDEFYVRFATRDLRQMIYVEQVPEPPKRFVMLLDASGSMRDQVGMSGITAAEFASASAIALLSNALRGGNDVVLAYYDSQPHPPLRGTPEQIVEELVECRNSDGGTSIDAALRWACELTPTPSEIIIITDGVDNVTVKPTVPVVSYLIGGDNEGLRRISRQYHQVVDVK